MVKPAVVMTLWCSAVGFFCSESKEARAKDTKPDYSDLPYANAPTLYYIPPGKLIDIYVSPTSNEDKTPFSEDISRVNGPDYGFRTGFNYHFGNMALNFDTRMRKADASMKLTEDNDAPRLKVDMKPWEFRIGLSYKWGKKR